MRTILSISRLSASESPRDSLTVADGTISAPDGRKIGYGELAADADLHREATAKVDAKAAGDSQDRR